MTTWGARMHERLEGIRRAQQWRSIRTLDGRLPEVLVDGRPVVSFASNDYLGLSSHPAVAAAARAAIDRWGTGSGASRLVVGGRPIHAQLEEELADWKGTEAALLIPTGFAANLAVLATLGSDPDVLVVSDELNRASIIDGCRQSHARVAVARHNDVQHVDGLLTEHAGPALVVTDTVFSMDGDQAPVAALAGVCRRHDALLVLDEAHAVMGPEHDLPGAEVVRVGTLSKTLGSLGGFVAGSRDLIDLLVNTARPFIFTTASTPADTAAALVALRILRSPEGAALVARLRAHVDAVAPGHPSPIVPLVLGDEAAAMEASARLLEQGLLVPAIRPPTVPAGTSRLRVALSAAHTDGQVERLVKALADLPLPSGPLMLVLCAGTATEVGKTWTGAATLRELRAAGYSVSARKPAQSWDPGDDGSLDSEVLAAATGEDPHAVCSAARTYPLPMAPPMAADALGRPAPTMRDVLDELVWPEPEPQVCWVESVGGPRSPLAEDGDTVALARALTPRKVVLVAEAGLGTVNATLLSLAPFLELGLQPVVLLNRFDTNDDLHRRNAAWLSRHDVAALLSVAALVDVLSRAV